MKEYIERESLHDEIRSLSVLITGLRCGKGVLNEYMKQYRESVLRIVDEQPTADVQEVRHGHWFILEYEYFTCSECGYYQPNGCDSTKEAKEKLAEGKVPKYCAECGARMDGDEE